MKAEGAPHGIHMDELIVSVFIGTVPFYTSIWVISMWIFPVFKSDQIVNDDFTE